MSDITTVKIPLSKPIEIDGTQVTELQMREPLVQDQLQAEEQAGESRGMMEIILFANLCGIPFQYVKGMRIKDYAKMQKAYSGFTS